MTMKASTGLRNDMMKSGGNSFADAMVNCVARGYTGTQPATADAAETGTLLIEFTLGSGAFTPGVATNGMNFDVSVDGVVSKSTSETWSGEGVAAGVIGYLRVYDNARTAGISTSARRFDLAAATTGAQLNLSTTTVSIGGTVTIDTATVALPA